MLKLLAHVVPAVLSIASAAAQAYDGPMRFSVFLPCNGNASFCAPQILAEGMIGRTTDAKFSEFLANRRAHKHQLPPQPIVAFDSAGGNVAGAMALGHAIRKRKFDTLLAPNYSQIAEPNLGEEETVVRDAKCASACALAFVGGLRREVAPESRFGIHQFSSAKRDLGDSATQVAVVVLATYLAEMGVKRELLDAASLVPPKTMYWLSSEEARRLRVDNTRPSANPWSIGASPQGVPFLHTAHETSPGRTVRLAITASRTEALMLVMVRFDRTNYAADRLKLYPLGEEPRITIRGDGLTIAARALEPWTKSEETPSMVVRALAALTLADLRLLSSSRALSLSDDFPNALSDLTVASELSTEGLASGVALLLRTR